jgi:hypothetical protein
VAIDGSAHRPHEKPRLRVKRVQRLKAIFAENSQGSEAARDNRKVHLDQIALLGEDLVI